MYKYKSFVIGDDTYTEKSSSDLLRIDVVYQGGVQGVVYLNRATVNRLLFEMSHKRKVMEEKDFEDYRELILEEERTERSYDED